jgi:hypothetical protein
MEYRVELQNRVYGASLETTGSRRKSSGLTDSTMASSAANAFGENRRRQNNSLLVAQFNQKNLESLTERTKFCIHS